MGAGRAGAVLVPEAEAAVVVFGGVAGEEWLTDVQVLALAVTGGCWEALAAPGRSSWELGASNWLVA